MKKYLSLVIILPLLVVSQTDFCGERPIKPTQLDNQSKKEYKQSTVFLNYKKILKEWKECMSPLAVSKRDEERLEQERQAREMQIVEEQLVNPCGEKPEKPKRMKGLSIDEYRETTEFKNYRERLKDWKKCMSPQNLTEPIFNKSNNTEINPKNICGEKPEKPIREDGLNHEEYKQTSAYQEYREKIKTWKECLDENE